MRFICVLAAFALTLSLASCSDNSAAKPCDLDENFQGSVKISQSGKDFSAEIEKGEPQTWKFEFTQPETISGMTLTATGETCKVDFMGLSYATPCENLSRTSMVFLTSAVIDKLIAKSDITCTKSDEKILESGTVNGHDFTASFSDGKLKTIEISNELTCEFT